MVRLEKINLDTVATADEVHIDSRFQSPGTLIRTKISLLEPSRILISKLGSSMQVVFAEAQERRLADLVQGLVVYYASSELQGLCANQES